jgi:hypothetical protein
VKTVEIQTLTSTVTTAETQTDPIDTSQKFTFLLDQLAEFFKKFIQLATKVTDTNTLAVNGTALAMEIFGISRGDIKRDRERKLSNAHKNA